LNLNKIEFRKIFVKMRIYSIIYSIKLEAVSLIGSFDFKMMKFAKKLRLGFIQFIDVNIINIREIDIMKYRKNLK